MTRDEGVGGSGRGCGHARRTRLATQRAITSADAPRASLSDGPRRHSRDVIAPREPQSLGHVNDDAHGAAGTNTAVRVIRVDVAPGTRAVTPWRRWPDARRWKDAACSLFTPKRLRRGGSVPEPVLWANQSATREVVTDIAELAFVWRRTTARTRPARLVCRRPKRCPRRMRRHEGSTCAVAARRWSP